MTDKPVLKSYEEVIATLPEKFTNEAAKTTHGRIHNQTVDQMKAAIDELYGVKK